MRILHGSVAPAGAVIALAVTLAPLAVSRTTAAAPQGLAGTDSINLVERAITAMGGLETLGSLRAVRIAGFEQQNMLEQSERPGGPFLVTASTFEEWRDFEGMRLRQRVNARSLVLPPAGLARDLIVADGLAAYRSGDRTMAAGPGTVEAAEDALALGPERLLLVARGEGTLRGVGVATLQGVVHDIVAFRWNGRDVSVWLNRDTGLPTAAEWVRVFDDAFWSIWGDVTARIEYGAWFLEAGGLLYPRQWTESRNGMPYRDRTILEFEADPELDDEMLALPASLGDQMEARAAVSPERVGLGVGFDGTRAEPQIIAPGVTQIRGMWNVALIEQADGIVILEAPISSRYSEQVIAEARRRFPGRPIKAVVTTSDAWPHVAGIREYVALGVPIHALSLNAPLLARIIAAPRTRRPDRLAGFAGTEAHCLPVASPTTIGAGDERMILLPVRGEGSERRLAVYFPAQRLLYASDLVQPGQSGFFMPSYLAELEALVQRESLAVETVFAMHLAPTPWQAVLDALAEVRNRPRRRSGSD